MRTSPRKGTVNTKDQLHPTPSYRMSSKKGTKTAEDSHRTYLFLRFILPIKPNYMDRKELGATEAPGFCTHRSCDEAH